MEGELFAVSDARLKTQVQTIQAHDALSQLRALRPVTFQWIGTEGAPSSLGFIAQEVQGVLPEAVNVDAPTFIPDILTKVAHVVDARTIAYQPAATLLPDARVTAMPTAGERVRVVTLDQVKLDGTVASVTVKTNGTVHLTFEEDMAWDTEPDAMLVYGRCVDDQLSVNKDAIFTVTCAAVQELDRRLQEQTRRLDRLEQDNAELRALVTAMAGKLETI